MLVDKSSLGLYKKFRVRRTDGNDAQGCKHFNCEYFVLDLTHDKFAVAAIKAYANACEEELPVLARDLRLRAVLCDASNLKPKSVNPEWLERVLRFVVGWLNVPKEIRAMLEELARVKQEVAETKTVIGSARIAFVAIVASMRALADKIVPGIDVQVIKDELNAMANELDTSQNELAVDIAQSTAAADEIVANAGSTPTPPAEEEDDEVIDDEPPATEPPVNEQPPVEGESQG